MPDIKEAIKDNANVDLLYKEREDFCVIALTGYTASGCSSLARLMENPNFISDPSVRQPVKIGLTYPDSTNNADIYFTRREFEINKAVSALNFKRKYAICHDFVKTHYLPFRTIRYSAVLLMILLEKLAEKIKKEGEQDDNQQEALRKGFINILKDKFQPAQKHEKDYIALHEANRFEKGWLMENDLSGLVDWQKLSESFKALTEEGNKAKEGDYNNLLADIFFSEVFTEFHHNLNELIFKADYYCACMFYHRLGYQIRKCDDPLAKYADIYDKSDEFSSIYTVVRAINRILKGYRHMIRCEADKCHAADTGCRVVIDSVRNSLEARYLKERYSGFYLIAVHDTDHAFSHLAGKIESVYAYDEATLRSRRSLIDMQISFVKYLGDTEKATSDFEKGKFASHNVEQCVADAEIHISNSSATDSSAPLFQSMAEQWMKYAALIFHPGLITPSSEERCMVVAYTAKFNSGCLSRQVGAVITNNAHVIRSIGWNDVPYGQTPCSLRSLYDIPYLNAKGEYSEQAKELAYIYSAFEQGILKKYKDGEDFAAKTRLKYSHLNQPDKFPTLRGLPFSYCFKSHHNEYEGVKNQVHTRALHAEENAILQMARFGGMPIENGVIYVTASPCELCCKKLYQIGIRKIVFIDEYPGISRENIISIGFRRPDLKHFQGAYGATYFKLYQPVMPYKNELELRLQGHLPEARKADPAQNTLNAIKAKGLDPTRLSTLDDATIATLRATCPDIFK